MFIGIDLQLLRFLQGKIDALMQETMQGALEKEIGTELKTDVAINNGSFTFATFKTSEVGEQQFSHKLHKESSINDV